MQLACVRQPAYHIQTVFLLSNYILNSRFPSCPGPPFITAKEAGLSLEFCVSQPTLIHLTLKAESGPMKGYHPNSKTVRYTQETEIMFVTVGC